MRHAFTFHMEDLAGLSPAGNFQLLIAVQCRHFDLRTQHCLCDIDIQVQQNIILATLEELMRLDVQNKEQGFRCGPPKAPGPPSPAKRICVPVSTPGGICTFFVTRFRSNPPPRQVWHGDEITSPRPSQVGQVVVCIICPRIVCRTCRTCPCPPQVEQRVGEVPGSAPEPLQREQAFFAFELDLSFNTENGLFEFQRDLAVADRARGAGTFSSGPVEKPNWPKSSSNISEKSAV